MKRIRLLIFTLIHVRPIQIFYRIYYRFYKLRIRPLDEPCQRKILTSWAGAMFFAPFSNDGESFIFLNKKGDLHKGWNDRAHTQLWLYKLHYLDDLNSKGCESKVEIHRRLIERWIADNPPFRGVGWEPYCLSLRIVNLIKWLARQGELTPNNGILKSLVLQADALTQQLEFHVLANHLFANAKALVFSGVFIGGKQGDAWLKSGLKLLDSELDEQFMEDGGHYERSPMYHAVLLWDVCDLLQLAEHTQLTCLTQRRVALQSVLKNGMHWLRKMVHPDGDISFFNDSTFGVAPRLEDLERYCLQLGIIFREKTVKFDNWSATRLKNSGYIILERGSCHKALLNIAEIGPAYQPGHAHADTLSFELSLFGQRLFVNSGISMYGTELERERQRGTSAHNTVEVDNENSSEIWSGFRVARRARPVHLSTTKKNKAIQVTASHDGYVRLPGKVLTERSWSFEQDVIEVYDRLTGDWSSAVSRFYCHPSIMVNQINSREVRLTLPQGQTVIFSVTGSSKLRLSERAWYPGFGISVRNYCIEVPLCGPQLLSRIMFVSH